MRSASNIYNVSHSHTVIKFLATSHAKTNQRSYRHFDTTKSIKIAKMIPK